MTDCDNGIIDIVASRTHLLLEPSPVVAVEVREVSGESLTRLPGVRGEVRGRDGEEHLIITP